MFVLPSLSATFVPRIVNFRQHLFRLRCMSLHPSTGIGTSHHVKLKLSVPNSSITHFFKLSGLLGFSETGCAVSATA